jgi:hypothetical protein
VSSYFDVISALAALGIALLVVSALNRWFARSRPHFDVSGPLLVGLGVRALSIALLTAAPDVGNRIRGTDEAAFVQQAGALLDLPLDDVRWRHLFWGDLSVLPLLSLRLVSGEVPIVAARFIQSSIALVGILLIAVAAYELGGTTASKVFAWIAALEPAGVFFSTLLHDEAIVLLGEGLIILGLVTWWRRSKLRGTAFLTAGAAILVGARPYLGGASVLACCVALGFIETERRFGLVRALGLAASVSVIGVAAALVALPQVAPGQLQSLQFAHDYEYVGYSNLDLPPVEVTTTAGLADTLSARTIDFVTRPFPWQAENTSQRLGALGTLVWYGLAVAALAALALVARRRELWVRAVPILLLACAQSAAYALSLVNAGLGFRHRMHLALMVAFVLAVAWTFIELEAENGRLRRARRGAVPQSQR